MLSTRVLILLLCVTCVVCLPAYAEDFEDQAASPQVPVDAVGGAGGDLFGTSIAQCCIPPLKEYTIVKLEKIFCEGYFGVRMDDSPYSGFPIYSIESEIGKEYIVCGFDVTAAEATCEEKGALAIAEFKRLQKKRLGNNHVFGLCKPICSYAGNLCPKPGAGPQ